MPTYEYVCQKCDEHLEVFQSFNDKPLKKHDECGGDLKKRFHASGIVFKGSGFYATDSKAATATKSTTSDDKKPKKSTDSKPKAETAAKSSSDD